MKHPSWVGWNSRDGAYVVLLDLDLRARFWRFVANRLCFCWLVNTSWVWRVPVGWPRRGEDGLLDNSLGGALWSVETAAWSKALMADQACEVLRLPVTSEQARVVFPELEDTEEKL